jgi:hypothetical protein
MKPYVKFGLIVGAIGFVVIIPISGFMGICGPFTTMIAGAVAGFLSAYVGEAPTRRDGAQSGAIAGAVSGGVTLMGQLIGGVLALAFIQTTGTPVFVGRVPGPSAPFHELTLYYAVGIGTALCFGIVGIVVAAIAGAIAGALGARELPRHVDSESPSKGEP